MKKNMGNTDRIIRLVDGQIVARRLVNLSLAADHRTSDGHLGGQLLAAIQQHLQSPETL